MPEHVSEAVAFTSELLSAALLTIPAADFLPALFLIAAGSLSPTLGDLLRRGVLIVIGVILVAVTLVIVDLAEV